MTLPCELDGRKPDRGLVCELADSQSIIIHLIDIPALYEHSAGTGPVNPSQHMHQGGLTAAGTAHHGDCRKTGRIHSGGLPGGRRYDFSDKVSEKSLPELGRSTPPSICTRVDLPLPELPTTATNSPASTSRHTFTTEIPPGRTVWALAWLWPRRL